MEVMSDYPKFYLYRRIVQAKLFIDNHFSGAVDLETSADEAAFSKFHFIRIFKEVYGKTPHQYLTWVRIEQAKRLLAEGMPVSQVCFEVGFESISSFSGLFKRFVGSTPSAFGRIQMERKVLISENPLRFIPNCFAEQNGWSKNAILKK